jgi:hypothetical protein
VRARARALGDDVMTETFLTWMLGWLKKPVRYCCPFYVETGTCRQILMKLPNIRFHEYRFSRSSVVT